MADGTRRPLWACVADAVQRVAAADAAARIAVDGGSSVRAKRPRGTGAGTGEPDCGGIGTGELHRGDSLAIRSAAPSVVLGMDTVLPAAQPAPPPRAPPEPLAASTFYGRPVSTDAPRDAYLLRLLAGADRRLRASAGPPPFRVFARQAPAFEYADAAGPGARLCVFSAEAPRRPGARVYVATTLPEFWARYRTLPPGARHCYEILREGRPCHVYLDIEFYKPLNPGVDGDALVDDAVRRVLAVLAADHGVTAGPEDVLELDASSDAKFSRHVTVRAPGAAMAGTTAAGALVRAALRDGEDAVAPCLMVRKDADGGLTPAVDLAVYTRNRAWRMAGSAKAAAPERVLRPTARYGGAGASERAAFFAGLAGDVPDGSRLLERDDVGAGGRGCGGGDSGGHGPPGPRLWRARSEGGRPAPGGVSPGPSPMPSVDAFVEDVASARARTPTSVRAWALAPDGVLLLALRGGRFCANVGRNHRSNGVYYLVDLQAGVCVQRCYDPDCRGFRAAPEPLPADVLRSARGALPALLSECGLQGTAAVGATGGPHPLPALAPWPSDDPFAAGPVTLADDDPALLAAVAAAEAAALAQRAAAHAWAAVTAADDGDSELAAAVDAAEQAALADRAAAAAHCVGS